MKANWINIVVLLAVGLGSCMDTDDPNAQLNNEINQIDTYLETYGYDDNAIYTTTGIRLVLHNYGQDAPPQQGQTVTVSRTGRLFAEQTTIFESGQLQKKIDDITPDGLRFCIASLMSGSSATVYIPSKYGYGSAGSAPYVPADAILIYDIFLHNVERTATQTQRFQQDTAAIHNYIIDNSIANAVEHSSGIWYTVDEPGSGGIYPTVYQNVTFDYKLKLLTTPGSVLQDDTFTGSIFGSLIDGLKIGLPLIREGSTATFYIPSGLAYGPTGSSGGISANANLIFQIKLTSIAQQ